MSDAGDGAGISIGRTIDPKDVSDDCLTGDRDKEGLAELCEALKMFIEAEIVIPLFGEVDPGVEDDIFPGQSGRESQGDFFLKEGEHGGPDIVVELREVWDLWLADAVHNEQFTAVSCGEFRISAVWKPGNIVDEIDLIVR